MKIRCYLPPPACSNATARITGSQAHHLAHVLRITKGTEVVCFDGEGSEADGIVKEVRSGEILLHLKSKKVTSPLPWRITLAVAVPGNGKLDHIVDEATQLGLGRLIPLSTARTVVKFSAPASAKKRERWLQIAISAARQSGVDRLPAIELVMPWNHLLSSFRQYDLVLMATVDGPHERLSSLVSGIARGNLLLLVGPEGDFTPQEIGQATKAGAHRVGLGPTVLRCETAVVAFITLVSSFLREAQER